MNTASHIVVWLDHRTARIYRLTPHMAQKTVIQCPDTGGGNIHHHAGTPGSGHMGVDKSFLENIVGNIGDTREVLLVGPADAKHALKSFLEKHNPQQAAHILGMEAMDHASDGEIVAAARRFFDHADRMAPQP